MSANVADILRAHGFAPVAPQLPRKTGAAQTQAPSRAPVAPVAPHRKHAPELVTAKPAPSTGINPAAIRRRLLELAAAAFMDTKPIRALSESFLRECDGMADDALRALLSMLRDDADRRAGRVPEGHTAAMLCQSCGPVWIHPSIAAVLPVVDGWPRALGCPWCFIRKAGLYVPRPSVECGTCRHFQPDKINPAQGRGQCACGSFWPAQRHACGQYRPAPSNEGKS